MFTSNRNDAFSMSCSWRGTCSPSAPALLKARSSRPNSSTARTTSSPSLAPRLPMTSEAPALAIANAVALPMPVPPPVTMPTLLAKDAMSTPRRRGTGVRADRQRRIGAVQMFHRGEDQVGVTDVLDVVKQILAGAEVEVPGF